MLSCAHRREIRKICGETLSSNELDRNRAREVDVLNGHVGGDHLIANHRGVIADLWKEFLQPGDQLAFVHRRNTGTIGASGFSNGSPYVTASRKRPEGGAVGKNGSASALSRSERSFFAP